MVQDFNVHKLDGFTLQQKKIEIYLFISKFDFVILG